MMKFFIALSCLLLGASALHEEVIKAQWAAYKAKHGKEYHPSEEESRLNNFLEATIQIENHNARFHRGEVSFELGHNHFSDLSHDEFIATRLGRESMNVETPDVPEALFEAYYNLPASIDWRSNNLRIKDQGNCGSCYAFAVVGVVEALLYNKTGKEYDLSEQQIVDCSYHMMGGQNKGCYAGQETVTIEYITRGGLLDEKNYPYTSGSSGKMGRCMWQSVGGPGQNLKPVKIDKNENALVQAVARYGPVLISMYGQNEVFRHYKGGIFDDPDCQKLPNHLMSVVGYGTEDGTDFWILRNSWGTSWGERGYARLLRGDDQCGIVTAHPHAIIL